MLESREALISATQFALDHVIEQARFELGSLYGIQPSNLNQQEDNHHTEGASSNPSASAFDT
jgi:hypothetical protein